MAVAAIAALSSCSSDDIANENGSNAKNAPVFTATIEGEGTTRTQLVEGSTPGKLTKVNWVSGDKVNINGSAYTAAPGDPDATTATLTIVDGETAPEAVDGKYYAVYPSSIAFNTSTQTLTLPATQTYDATANGIGNVPMIAVSTTTELEFKNICAVLAVSVSNEDVSQVKAIKVEADKALSGAFSVTAEGVMTMATPDDNTQTVTLTCAEAVTMTSAETTFYIAIPAQEYSYLKIYVSGDGTQFDEQMSTKAQGGIGALARNTIYAVSYAKNAVQLWDGGIYWATRNVGAENPEDYGDYFMWGETETKSSYGEGAAYKYGYYNDEETAFYVTKYFGSDGNTVLEAADDAATANWGGAWRMPTNAEQTKLREECYWQSVTSYNGKSVNGYVVYKKKSSGSYSVTSDAHIFLPAAGYHGESGLGGDGTEGNYWSSSLYEPDSHHARILFFSDSVSEDFFERYYGFSVRPVCSSSE